MTPRNLEARFDKAVQLLIDRFRELGGGEVKLRFALYDKAHDGELLSRDETLRALDVRPAQFKLIDLAVVNRGTVGNVVFVRPSGFLANESWEPTDEKGIEPFKLLVE